MEESNEKPDQKGNSEKKKIGVFKKIALLLLPFLAISVAYSVYYYFTGPTVVGYYTISTFKASDPDSAEVSKGAIVKEDGEYSLRGNNGRGAFAPVPSCDKKESNRTSVEFAEIEEKVEESLTRPYTKEQTTTQYVFTLNDSEEEKLFYESTKVAAYLECD